MQTVQEFIEILEELIERSRNIPFTKTASIDRERAMELLNDIRLNLPEEIMHARWIEENEERILNEARLKAANVIADAERRAMAMTMDHEIYKKAEEEADMLLEDARAEARDIRLNALDYADEKIEETESMIREAMMNMDQQHKMMHDYFSQTVDILYSNRQELRSEQ